MSLASKNVAALLLASAGCTYPATEVLIALDTDVPAVRTLIIHVAVLRGDTAPVSGVTTDSVSWVRGSQPKQITLPATFAVVPDQGQPQDGLVTLVVEGEVTAMDPKTPAVRISRTARFAFVPHRTMHIPIFLPLRCHELADGCTSVPMDQCTVTARCEEQGLTCGNEGTCVPIDLMPPHPGPDAEPPIG